MRALVIGSSGGIGQAIFQTLQARDWAVTGLSRTQDGLDIRDEASIKASFTALTGPFELVFVATGALVAEAERPEKSLREVSASEMEGQHKINAVGPMLVLKHALNLMPKDDRAVFAALSARVGSIGDNQLGGWHSYRASKAALNQYLHGAAIELKRTRPHTIIAALHPGTVATPFTEAYAKSHSRTEPSVTAGQLLDVIDGLTADDNGGFFDYAGKTIPW